MNLVAVVFSHQRVLNREIWGGFANYVNEFLREFSRDEIGSSFSELNQFIECGFDLTARYSRPFDQLVFRLISRFRPLRLLYRFFLQIRFDKSIKCSDFILFHQLNSFELPPLFVLRMARRFQICLAVTIIDFQELEFPNFFDVKVRRKRADVYGFIFKNSTLRIAASNFLLQKAEDLFGPAPFKSERIPLGVDRFSKVAIEMVERELPKPYFLLPAKSWTNKGHQGLLSEFEELRPSFSLVLTGITAQELSSFGEPARDSIYGVSFFGNVKEGQLKYLYINSSGLLFPSLYEGYGLPYFESAIMERPIIAFENAAVKEHFPGDNVYLAPIGNYTSLLKQAELSLSDEDLGRRISANYRYATSLTWENHFCRLKEIYIDLINFKEKNT